MVNGGLRIALILGGWLTVSGSAATAGVPIVHHAESWEEAKKAIWGRELAIYDGRSRGDLSLYLASIAAGYVAWPPFNEVPKGEDGLRATGKQMAGKTRERIAMTFLDLALNGDTAVVYYKTHRTFRADGTPVDEHYEVTHTWIMQDGTWKVLGGMARARPSR
jgi:ketosteroid isomerase-like protein